MLHVYCRVLRTVDSIDIAILISMSFLNIYTQKRQDRTDELSTCPCRSHNGLTCIRTPSIESFHPAINDRVRSTVHTPTSTQPHMYSTEYTQKLTHITKKTTPTSFLLSPTQSHLRNFLESVPWLDSSICRLGTMPVQFLCTPVYTNPIHKPWLLPTPTPSRPVVQSIHTEREREDKYCTE